MALLKELKLDISSNISNYFYPFYYDFFLSKLLLVFPSGRLSGDLPVLITKYRLDISTVGLQTPSYWNQNHKSDFYYYTQSLHIFLSGICNPGFGLAPKSPSLRRSVSIVSSTVCYL